MGSEVLQYPWRSVMHTTCATVPLDAQFPREAIGISSTAMQAITHLYNAWKDSSMERVKRLQRRLDESNDLRHALTRGLHFRDFVSWHRTVAVNLRVLGDARITERFNENPEFLDNSIRIINNACKRCPIVFTMLPCNLLWIYQPLYLTIPIPRQFISPPMTRSFEARRRHLYAGFIVRRQVQGKPSTLDARGKYRCS